MKKTASYLFPLLIVFAIVSCKEEPPPINYESTVTVEDSTYIMSTVPAAEKKAVLLEDISGVKCVNCPDAATIAKNIVADAKALSTPRIVNVITVQPDISGLDQLTKPIDQEGVKTIRDLRTKAGGAIVQMVGIPNSLPNGYVNRRKFSGKLDPILSREEWSAAVGAELQDSTPVNIEVSAEYDRTSSEMKITAILRYTRAVMNSNYLSVAILEDSIVDAQEKKEGIDVVFDQNYLHRHVLRDMVTNYTGDLLNSTEITLVPGRYIKRVYRKKIAAYTKPEHFSVVAYVHEDATSKYVLHSAEGEVHLK